MATCIISGTIQNLDGSALAETQVRATPASTEADQSGQLAGAVGVTSEPVTAFTDDSGAFSIALLQGALVDFEIPAINLKKRITVPSDPGPVSFDTLI